MSDIEWTDLGNGAYSADTDHNGNPDVLAVDTSGDGTVDVYLTEEGNGKYLMSVDRDGDGTFEDEVSLTRADMEELVPSALEILDPHDADNGDVPDRPQPGPETDVDPGQDVDPGTDPADPATDPQDPDGGTDYPDVVVDGQIIGDPVGDSQFWFQQAANGFCLPASVAQIISEYTGVDYTNESTFVEWANQEHLFVVGPDGVPGIQFQDGVALLEKAGVPATLEVGDLNSLAEDLAEGRGIVLFIDSGEIWEGEATEDNAPDHAVVVTGIDTERGTVILSDPGSPDGNLEEVPIETFMDAWADSEYSMIVCDQPAPDTDALTDVQTDVAVANALDRSAGWALLPVTLPEAALAPAHRSQ